MMYRRREDIRTRTVEARLRRQSMTHFQFCETFLVLPTNCGIIGFVLPIFVFARWRHCYAPVAILLGSCLVVTLLGGSTLFADRPSLILGKG